MEPSKLSEEAKLTIEFVKLRNKFLLAMMCTLLIAAVLGIASGGYLPIMLAAAGFALITFILFIIGLIKGAFSCPHCGCFLGGHQFGLTIYRCPFCGKTISAE